MSKREFLSKLEEALVYEMPPRAVTENLRYYSSYIDSEKGKGRSEEEVLDELGDPRLIARTIIEAEKSGEDGIPGTADDVVWQETPYSARTTGYDRSTESSDRETGREDYNADPEENRDAPERMGEYTGVSFKDDFDQLRTVPLLLNRQPGAAVPSPFEPPFRDEPCNRLAHRLDVDAEFRRQLRRGRQQTCVNPFLNPPPQFRHDGRLFVLDHDIPFRLFYYNHTPVIPEVNIKPY